MKRNYYIITGTSRGIGEALAKKLLAKENVLYCISRNQNPRLTTEGMIKGLEIHDLALDLSNLHDIADLMRKIFREIDPEEVAQISLINNAGTVHPIRSIGSNEAAEHIIRNIAVNLSAAMVITDMFVREVQDWEVPKHVLNMSTGAASRVVRGWSAYCSAKAGLEMYAHCLAMEQEDQPHPVKIVSFAPGIVNTEMQAEIRSAPADQFPESEKFHGYKEQGLLLSPEKVAETIIELMAEPGFGQETMVHIRNL